MNVGLIGCGGIAHHHLKVFNSMRNVEVVGACDLDLRRAEMVAHNFGVKRAFEDYHDLLMVEDLDLVDICTPISTHAKIVCDAAKAVPAIIVEKPMALSISECDKMIREVKKHGSKLCISHQQIFLPSIQKAKSLVDNGIYDLVSFETRQKESFEQLRAHRLAADWMVAPEQGGIIWEVCCHLAYLQLHFLPDINEVYAVGGKVKYPVYDHFAVLLRTPGERFGIIDLSWASTEPEVVYEICDSGGKRAQIHRNFDDFLEKQSIHPFSVGGIVRSFFVEERRILRRWAKFGLNYIHKKKMIPHFKLFSDYLVSIEEDLPPPVTPEDGRKTVKLLECIRNSLDEHRPLPFND